MTDREIAFAEYLASGSVLIGGVGVATGVRAGEFFEEVGVLDGRADLVVSGGPLAEVEDAAAVGAEGEVFVGGEDDLAARRAEECFGSAGHGSFILEDGRGLMLLIGEQATAKALLGKLNEIRRQAE
jgi:hypothetical protein